MPRWQFAVPLDNSGRTPFFRQIVEAVAEDIRRGRLRAGDPLPGTRRLADTLRLNRNTVVAAYSELRAEGWIQASEARGTFVSEILPDPNPRRLAFARAEAPPALGYDLAPLRDMSATTRDGEPPRSPGTLAFLPGSPDVRLVPVDALARAYRSAVRAPGRRTLAYGDPRGHPRLRAALGTMLSATRGLAAPVESVIVTRGSQMAVALVARALLRPGDVVAVEELGYTPAFDAFRAAGARLVPIPLDGDGLRLDALEALLLRAPVRALYVTPHHQYPTTATLPSERRLRLLQLARAHRFALVEDDYDHEFQYEGRPLLPLASADAAGVVVYVGTLSKVLAPGLRIGYVVAPPPLVERLALERSLVDVQGDLAIEAAVAELLEEGEILRHVRRVKRIYEARRDALVEALRAELGDDLSFDVPRGGMALWVRVRSGLDVEEWAKAARDYGVVVFTARSFSLDGQPRPYLRLGFGALSEKELREGVVRLLRARPLTRPQDDVLTEAISCPSL